MTSRQSTTGGGRVHHSAGFGTYHPSVLPDAPERRKRDEELQEALDAAQATPEEGGPAAGHLPRSPARSFFSAGRRWCAVSHMPVDTAQCRASAITKSRRASRSG